MSTVAKHVFLSGKVQGVGFRWAAVREATRAGVHGWVRNLSDGRVEAFLEGEQSAVDELVRWLRGGPPGARVDDLVIEDAETRGRASFDILPTSAVD